MLSGLLLFRGDWPEARRQAEAAADEYQREGAEIHPAWALRGLALVAAHDGRLDDARAWATEGARRGGRTGRRRRRPVPPPHPRLRRPDDRGVGGGRRPAHRRRRRMADQMAVRQPGRFKLAGDQVEAALALGDVDRAAAVVERLDEAARVAPTPWVVAVGLRSAALVAAARGDMDRAIDLLTDGARGARPPADAVRAGPDAAREGPHPSAPEGEAARRRDAPRGARRASSRSGRPTGSRSRNGGARPRRPPPARPNGPHRHRAAGRRARRHRPHHPRDRRARVPRPEDRRATCSAGSTRSSASTRGPSSAR